MKTRLFILSLLVLAAVPLGALAAGPEDSVVRVTATVRYPNPVRPWTKSNAVEVAGTGVVIEGTKKEKKVLTNAHLVLYATEVHIEPRNGGDKIEAKVEALGPDVDLAVLTPQEGDLKFPALVRSEKVPKVQDSVAVFGFPVGGKDLAVTKGVVSRINFGHFYDRSAGMVIQVSAAINPGNSGGPAVVGNQMIGLVFSRLNEAENTGYIIPNEEIDIFLADIQKDGRYHGKPVEAAGTLFQRLENPTLRRMLKLDKGVKGVLVRPPERTGEGYPLKKFDVLVRIGDHDIDNEGMVDLKDGFRAPFLCLVPKLARESAVPVTVLRDGRRVEVALPVTTKDTRLIRDYQGEQPSYFIHGPLVFSPVWADAIPWYSRLNPALYAGKSPLMTRGLDRVRFPGEELVVVTAPMFSHKIAKGYSDPVGRVVQEVNGVKIKNLRHLVETLRDSKDSYLMFCFADEWGEILVFDRPEMAKVTEEILEENGIATSRRGSADMLKIWKGKDATSR
jgi:S1-C subfamily serine protease